MEIRDKVFLQPSSGYHISIQWGGEFEGKKVASLVKEIKNYLQGMQPLKIDVFALYPSDNNLFVIPYLEDGISNLRTDISTIFDKHEITPKLPNTLETMWISTVRMKKEFTKDEIDLVVNNLPKKTFKDVTFDEITVCFMDQTFTKENSEILYNTRLS